MFLVLWCTSRPSPNLPILMSQHTSESATFELKYIDRNFTNSFSQNVLYQIEVAHKVSLFMALPPCDPPLILRSISSISYPNISAFSKRAFRGTLRTVFQLMASIESYSTLDLPSQHVLATCTYHPYK